MRLPDIFGSKVPREIRQPVLNAARTGDQVTIMRALETVSDLKHLGGLKKLAEGDWIKELGTTKTEILLTQLSIRMGVLGVTADTTPSQKAEQAVAPVATAAPTVPKGGGRGASVPLPLEGPESVELHY